MKEFGGIQSVFENAICPVPSAGGGVGATDVGGVAVPEGMKGTTGQMPEVSGVTVKDDTAPGPTRPSGMAGS